MDQHTYLNISKRIILRNSNCKLAEKEYIKKIPDARYVFNSFCKGLVHALKKSNPASAAYITSYVYSQYRIHVPQIIHFLYLSGFLSKELPKTKKGAEKYSMAVKISDIENLLTDTLISLK